MGKEHQWRAPAPLCGWAIVNCGRRSSWTAFEFLGRTRREARAKWISLYEDTDTGAVHFDARIENGDLRYARIVVREDSK